MTQPNTSTRGDESSDIIQRTSPSAAANVLKGGMTSDASRQSPPPQAARETIDMTAPSPVKASQPKPQPKVFSMFQRAPKAAPKEAAAAATPASSSSSTQVPVESTSTATNKRKAGKKASNPAASPPSATSSSKEDEPDDGVEAAAGASSSKRPRRSAAIAADAASATQANDAFTILKQASKAKARISAKQAGKSADNPVALHDDDDDEAVPMDADDDEVEFVASQSGTASNSQAVKGKAKNNKAVPAPAAAPPAKPLAPLSLQVRGTGCAPAQAHSFFAKRASRPQQASAGSDVAAAVLPSSPLAAGAKRKAQLEAAWPTRELMHVQPWREPVVALLSQQKRQALREAVQAGFHTSSTAIADARGNGKGKARDEASDGIFAQMAERDGRLRSSSSSTWQGPALSTQPAQLKRGQPRDVLPAFIADSISLSSVRDANGALPGAIEHLRRLALREEEAPVNTSTADLWLTRYKPRSAAQCLGNQGPATSLRDWLSELKVSAKAAAAVSDEAPKSAAAASSKRGKAIASSSASSKPTVQKRVAKQKGRRKKAKRATNKYGYADDDDESDGLDDFIVDTSEEEEEEEREEADGLFSKFRPDEESEDERMSDAAAAAASGGYQQLLQSAISGVARPSTASSSHAFTSPAPSSSTSPAGAEPSSSRNAWSRISEPYAERFSLADALCNCIVLAGPVGAGKTAGVYACAAELGFEVFELFAGMRRRAGKDVSSAVGDLGRNHMVGAGGVGGGAQGAFGALMRGAATKVKTGTTTEPRQSLILLEEVDLLFEEDKGFWPAVIELVAESRRPVVLTCNDLSMVPLSDLPIQAVLHFAAPSPRLAIPYLQLVALNEGHLLSATSVEQLYSANVESCSVTPAVLPKDGPLDPYTELISNERATQDAAQPVAPDLRAALMQLQFACQRTPAASRVVEVDAEESWNVESLRDANVELEVKVKTEKPETTPLQDLEQLKALRTLADTRSFADADLSRSFRRESDMYEPEQYGPSASDVQQHVEATQLWKTYAYPHAVALPQYGREDELVATMLQQATLIAQEAGAPLLPSFDRLAYDAARLQQSRSVWTLISAEQPAPWARAPHHLSATAYAPLIRSITQIDDAEARAHEASIAAARAQAASNATSGSTTDAAGAGGGRATRNSLRLTTARGTAAYERYFAQGPRELEAACFTALQV